jgi:hypothetical protein
LLREFGVVRSEEALGARVDDESGVVLFGEHPRWAARAAQVQEQSFVA